MESFIYNLPDELKNGDNLATNTILPQHHVFEHHPSAYHSEPVFKSEYNSERMAFPGPGHVQSALLSLQKYPRSFVQAWLLLAKSLGVTVQSVQGNYQSGSPLSFGEVGAIVVLKDMPHDQILAWYGDSGLNGPEIKEPGLYNHSTSNTCRSSTCSSTWTKRSSTRPSSQSSFLSVDRSPASQDKEKRGSKRLRSASVIAELPEVEAPSLDEPEQPSIYKCTGCPKSFKSMQTWSRHEKEDHEKIYYPCMPNGAIEVTFHGRECALCGQKPTEEHLESHKIERCTQSKQVFKRSYELKQHLESHGVAKKSKLSEILVTKWQQTPDKQAWACGFCKELFSSLAEFHKHIAVQHYERGEDREWDHTKVILGLLSQSFVADAWQRLLASRFRVQKLSCKWKRSKTGSLQSRLEIGRESGEVLAQAALECANYDQSFLHERFRCKELITPNSDSNSSTITLGPPVPSKPLPLRPSPPDRKTQGNHAPNDIATVEAATSDQFDNSSPLIFGTSIPKTERNPANLETANPEYSDNIFSDVNMGIPLDFDFDWHMDFPSHFRLPNEITESDLHCCGQGQSLR
ncbi:MAG: hypothetical protein Q9193_000478 [Seirophora villosa]